MSTTFTNPNGESAYLAWQTATVYKIDDFRKNVGKLYRANTAGTSGATAPTHTSGIVSDGGVNWAYITTFSANSPSSGDNIVGEGRISYRQKLSDLYPGVTNPTPAQSKAALEACLANMKPTGGSIYFSERIILNAPILWDGFVSLRGTGRSVIQRFGLPEPNVGAVLQSGVDDLGMNDFGWGGNYNQPNGLINVKLDLNLLANMSTRPRANIVFENFGIIGKGRSSSTIQRRGIGIRNVGTMYVDFRDLNIAWMSSWGIYVGSRGDTIPGSANGNNIDRILVTSCGPGDDFPDQPTGGGIIWASPDSFFGNIQVGGCSGIGLHVIGGNISGNRIHLWNNDEDNLRLQNCENVDFSVLAYDGDKTNIAITGSSTLVAIRGTAWHPNRRAQTAARDSSNLYIEDTCNEVYVDLNASGETSTIAYSEQTAWAAGQAISTGQYRVNANKLYLAASSGTTGATAPVHTSGTVSDGAVSWTFQNGYGLYGLYHEPSQLSIHNNGKFLNHRVQNYYMKSPSSSGATGGRHRMTIGTTPVPMFNASAEDCTWKVRCTRLAVNQDYIEATILGGSTPVILNEIKSVGSTLDLAISGPNLVVTCTITATGLFFWQKEISEP